MVSVSSEYLSAEISSLQDWVEMLRHLEPTAGPTGLPLIEQRHFDAWVREQLARTDLDDREQRCFTKDLSLFARRPYLNALSLEVPFTVTIAPVVDSSEMLAQSPRMPTVPEITLTVKWICPVCGHPLALSRRFPTWLDVRISLPGPTHAASGAQDVCSADTWVILEDDEEEEQEKEVPFSIQVWQVVHPQRAIGAPQGEQT